MKKSMVLFAALVTAFIAGYALNYQSTNAKEKQKVKKDQVKAVTQQAIATTPAVVQATSQAIATTSSNIVFIKTNGTLNVRAEANNKAAKVDIATKGMAVEVVEEKVTEKGESWKKITYMSGPKQINGWVKSEFTVTDRNTLIDETFRKLDFTPQEKINYPTNPRVKAKGIYLTVFSAGGKRLDQLIEMTKRTEINAFVIDVKDDDGRMLFKTKAAEKFAPKANNTATVKDIAALMKKLKENNIYTIARIVSFKDPAYTAANPDKAIIYKATGKPFTNADKLRWATAYDRNLWAYNIAVAKEAAEVGFNEIQFDYVRFPASNGGKLDKELDYRNVNNESKPQAIQEYLRAARKELAPMNVYTSADIYGLVSSVSDDMALGQYWEAVSNMTDYVCPMNYPSHYANGTFGLSVPDAYPYETVFNSTKDGNMRNKNLKTPAMVRPWIQDFTAAWVKGHIQYGEAQVRAQIKAMKDNGVEEYLLWNANNRYSEGALKK